MKGKFDFKKMSKVPGVLILGGGGWRGRGVPVLKYLCFSL